MKLSHVSWNFAGLTLPLIIAALVIPKLLENLGTQRFGLLALAWGLVGYASALDLGIGRALTQAMSTQVHKKSSRTKGAMLAAALQITVASGGVALILILALAYLGAEQWMGAEQVPAIEKTLSIVLLAFALPMQSISATYKGVNEAYLNFRKISILRVILGAANFGGPYLISIFTTQIHWIVSSLVLSRIVALYFYRKFAVSLIFEKPNNSGKRKKDLIKILKWRLLRFAGWITISSIINPIVNAADRFMLASIISASAVTVFVIPFELTTQSLIIVGAVTTVFFPYASRTAQSQHGKIKKDFARVLITSSTIMLGVTVGYLLFGNAVLSLWLKDKVNQDSVYVLQIISLGLAPYAIASLSTSLIHSRGMSKNTTVVNILMFFPALALIYWLTKYFGPVGAAISWVARIIIEAVCFFLMARWEIKKIADKHKIHINDHNDLLI